MLFLVTSLLISRSPSPSSFLSTVSFTDLPVPPLPMTTVADDNLLLDIDKRPWPIDSFLLSLSAVPNGVLSTYDMRSFMSHKDKVVPKLRNDIMLDEKLYFPSCYRPSTKHTDPAGNVVKTPSNLDPYLNETSCFQQGYCVRSKDWKNPKSILSST